MKIFHNIMIVFLLLACVEEEKQFSFDLTGISQLTIENKSPELLKVNFEKWSSIPALAFIKIDTLLAPDASISLDLENRNIDYIILNLNDRSHDIFLAPGSVDTVKFLGDNDLEFFGDLSPINKYLIQKSKDGLGFFAESKIRAEATHQQQTFTGLSQANDSITMILQDHIEMNGAALPPWYVKMEKQRLSYKNEGTKLNSFSYRKTMKKMVDTIPDDHFQRVFEKMPLENEAFIGEQNYMLFLHEYMNHKERLKINEVSDNTDTYLIGKARKIDEAFSSPVKDAVLAYYISSIIRVSRSDYDPAALDFFQNEELRDFIKDLYQIKVTLPPGTKIPYFFLQNLAGLEIEPQTYTGNILLINFWAEWCAPCIVEFPHENRLVEKYQDRPVKILNICIDSRESNWKSMVEKYGLKTENLYANEAWSNKIRNQYNIAGIPHSVLVDANGLIVENNTRTARNGVENLIDELLKKMP